MNIVPGHGSGLSVEALEGFGFPTRSRVFTDDDVAALVAEGPPPRGA